MQPWAQKLFDERKTGVLSAQDPPALPQGVPRINSAPAPFKMLQEPNVVVILYQAFGQYRQIFLDGRPLVKNPNPQWYGYSLATMDDPGAYTKPWTYTQPVTLMVDTELLEDVCNENVPHLKGK